MNLSDSDGHPLTKARSRRGFLAQAGLQGLAWILATRTCPAIRADEKPASEGKTRLDNEGVFRSATEMARMVRAKAISAEELVKAYLARISQVNGALNAVCQIDEAGALAAA